MQNELPSFFLPAAALVFFDQPMVVVNESVGVAQVCVVCSELPEREILIDLVEQTGTAQGTSYCYAFYYLTL